MLKLKPEVSLKHLMPQMVMAAIIVDDIYGNHGASCTITSGCDSKHGERTLHGQGGALDFRTKDYDDDKEALRDEIKAALGDEFDVVLEDLGGPNEHMHIEFDPKG